jgi:hypothetical protein
MKSFVNGIVMLMFALLMCVPPAQAQANLEPPLGSWNSHTTNISSIKVRGNYLYIGLSTPMPSVVYANCGDLNHFVVWIGHPNYKTFVNAATTAFALGKKVTGYWLIQNLGTAANGSWTYFCAYEYGMYSRTIFALDLLDQ